MRKYKKVNICSVCSDKIEPGEQSFVCKYCKNKVHWACGNINQCTCDDCVKRYKK